MADKEEFVLHVDDQDFEDKVLKAELPALVDFWAPWCFPCRMIAPAIEELARDYEGRVMVVKVNTDVNGATANAYGIQGIPTMIIFKNGQPVDRVTGAVPKHVLMSKLDRILAEEPTAKKGS